MTIRKSLWLPRDWIFPFLFFLISSAFIGGIVVGERFSPLFHLNRIRNMARLSLVLRTKMSRLLNWIAQMLR